MHLIQFFGCDAGFGYYIASLLWEAVVKVFHITDADHIANLVPEIVGIKTIAGAWSLLIVKLSVAAV